MIPKKPTTFLSNQISQNTLKFLIQIPHSVSFNSFRLYLIPHAWLELPCLFMQLRDVVKVNHLCDSTIGVDKVGRPSLMVICGIRSRFVFGLLLKSLLNDYCNVIISFLQNISGSSYLIIQSVVIRSAQLYKITKQNQYHASSSRIVAK
ncbi:Hypothetical_protein [Hexamita inflata]|uniref:Hypothetical_protein n=1 Tax=Hexamita inflata TaxID=28002 RepID=A0AA86PQ55_9EUKA|nr:Hypothetical protein HINF_LOCUS31774 [Hexamita inflata]